MQYTLKTKAGDILGIEEEMTNTLLNKFQAVFGQTAEVTVDLTVDDPNKPDQYSINFIGTVFDSEGKAVTVGKLVYIEDGRVVRIANINNG